MSYINWLLIRSDHKQNSPIRILEVLSRSVTHLVAKEEKEAFKDNFLKENESYSVTNNKILRPLTMYKKQKMDEV